MFRSFTCFLIQRRFLPKKNVDHKDISFSIRRTPSGNLPVYLIKHKFEVFTEIRKVSGHIGPLRRDCALISGGPLTLATRCRQGPEDHLKGATLRMPGNHLNALKKHLQNLGF